MSDEQIKDMLTRYVCAEMELLPAMDEIPEHPPYSKRFNRKMKHIMRAGDWFGSWRVYSVLYKAAAVVLIFLSLATANQVSAAVFGFNPWKAVTEMFDPTVKMNQWIYEKDTNTHRVGQKPLSDIPIYVPKGYKIVSDKRSDRYISLDWDDISTNDNHYGLTYDRDLMMDGTGISMDAEYESEEKSDVCGYEVKIYTKGKEVWIHWFDENYSYFIDSYGLEDAKSELMRMAESIYKKN
ncbi:MAG: DUF4367 domain-containing protein [Eubacterium sp.]|nr:DUF4367 domain-containing protein [Eubacterium sp.]